MDFIGPIVDKTLSILEARTPALLAAASLPEFVDYRKLFTGINVNFPSVYAMGQRTEFDPDMHEGRHEGHLVKIRFAISETEPDALEASAMGYMKAIDAALTASDPSDWQDTFGSDGVVLRVFVKDHDYGPLYSGKAGLARFPEMNLIVEAQEF